LCPIPNGFLDRAISLYIPDLLIKKEILCTVYNTNIYFSCNKVGSLHLHNAFLKIPLSTLVHFATSEKMIFCSSKFILTILYMGDNIHYVISSLCHVSNLLLYTLLFIQLHKHKSIGIRSGRSWWPVNGTAMTNPPIKENVIEILHHKLSIMRMGYMLKVYRNLCSQRNILYLFW
jgi:hypothetical protein